MNVAPRLSSLAAAFVLLASRSALAEAPPLETMIENAAARAGVERRIQAVGGLVAGAALTLGGEAVIEGTPSSDTSGRAAGYALLGSGVITLVSAPFAFFGADPVERLADDVRALPGNPGDSDRQQRIDAMLRAAARDERNARDAGAWTSGLVGAVFAGFAVNEALSDSDSPTSRVVRGASFCAGAAAAVTRALILAKAPGPIGVLQDNWSIARGASRPVPAAPPPSASSLTVTPTGLGVSISGAF